MSASGLNIDTIRSLASSGEFEAGEDYYGRGRVRNLVFSEGTFKAYVHRIGHYVVRIVPGNGALDTSCTCAYTGKGICRHIVAVALTVCRGKNNAGFHLLNLGDLVQPDALDLAMLQEWGWKDSDLPEPPALDVPPGSIAAREIMSAPVETLKPHATLDEAWDFVTQKHYRHVPVVDGGRVVGIVSDRDLLRAAARASRGGSERPGRVSSIMRRQVLTARPDTGIGQVARVMFAEHVGAILVTDENYELLGLITRSDVLRAVIDRF